MAKAPAQSAPTKGGASAPAPTQTTATQAAAPPIVAAPPVTPPAPQGAAPAPLKALTPNQLRILRAIANAGAAGASRKQLVNATAIKKGYSLAIGQAAKCAGGANGGVAAYNPASLIARGLVVATGAPLTYTATPAGVALAKQATTS